MVSTSSALIFESECHSLNGFQISIQEYYSFIEHRIGALEVPDIRVERTTLSEGGMLSHNREYLKIIRKENIFYVCTAPFGVTSFISWRYGEQASFLRRKLSQLPILKYLISEKKLNTTYFQDDATFMFRQTVATILKETTESILLNKGIRGRVELARASM